jgi:hypothetical protein
MQKIKARKAKTRRKARQRAMQGKAKSKASHIMASQMAR